MRGRRLTARTTLAILAGLVLVLAAGLVLASRQRDVLTFLPPEPEELQARRASPQNGYHLLLAAMTEEFPQMPGMLAFTPEMLVLRDGVTRLAPQAPAMEAQVEPWSIGYILESPRADDDPELLAYLAECEPAVENLNEVARTIPYYLVPAHHSWERTQTNAPVAPSRAAGRVMGALALRDVRVRGDVDAALGRVEDAMALGQVLLQDGDGDAFSAAAGFYWPVRIALCDILRTMESEEAIEAVQRRLVPYLALPRPSAHYAEFAFRCYPATVGDVMMRAPGPWRVFLGWRVRRTARAIRRDMDELLDLAGRPHYEISQLREYGQAHWYWGSVLSPTGPLVRVAFARDALMDHWSALEIAFALEKHRAVEGRYPESLEDLVPRYLDTVPRLHTARNESFTYGVRDGFHHLAHRRGSHDQVHWRAPAEHRTQ